MRVSEHKKDVDSATAKFTRAQRKSSLSYWNKSALTDHASQDNHVIDWSNIKVVGRESGKKRRLIREAIRIRQEATSLNRDGGNVELPHLWDPLICRSTDRPLVAISGVNQSR